VISDYNKGTIENPKQIIDYCHKNNIEVFVDPKKDLIKYSGATVIKPNLKEFLEWSNLSFEFYVEDFIENNYSELLDCRKRLGIKFLIITVGAEGCILVSDKVKLYSAPKTEEVDVTGAGDSFLAGLVSQYYDNKNIDKSIAFANAVASKAVSKKGTSYVRRKEL
jgi:D-beta-D-heptose 7-phosphate kinase/D-beta-D-heptose 1-phosphate adenosyltransferase